MPGSKIKNHRVESLDILRGIAVFLMILAHTIAFVHTGQNSFLNFLQNLGDTVCFTIFLLVSGASVYYSALKVSPDKWSEKRGRFIGRIIKLLLGYYFVAFISSLNDFKFPVNSSWLENILNILIFVKIPGYTEFLLPFIFFSILVVLFRKELGKLAKNIPLTILVGFSLYCFGFVFYQIKLSETFVYYKSIFVGEQDFYRFPLFQYFGVFAGGILLGKFLQKRNAVTNLAKLAFVSLAYLCLAVLISPLAKFPYSEEFQRWPPSIGFLSMGLAFAFGALFLLKVRLKIVSIPSIKTLFTFFGRFALALYIWHIAILQVINVTLKLEFSQISEVMAAFIVLITVSSFIIVYSKKVIKYILKVVNRPRQPKLSRRAPIKTHKQESKVQKKSLMKEKYFLVIIAIFLLSATGLVFALKVLSSSFISPDITDVDPIAQIRGAFAGDINIEIKGNLQRHWVLKGTTGVNEQYSKLPYTVEVTNGDKLENPPEFQILNTSVKGELTRVDKETFELDEDISTLAPGKYEIQATVEHNGETHETEVESFNVSYPLYVVWTIDWEGSDTSDEELENIVNFTQEHYNFPITHFFNPRIYVTDIISEERASYLTQWIIKRKYAGDEIGLHLHMHNDLVKAAGVTVRSEPKWTDYLNNGHDVLCSAYTYNEFIKILSWAKYEFAKNGLGTPISFRAGGWFADEKVLQALEDSGFLIDSSGRDYIIWGSNKVPSHWNLKSTTQPYHPSVKDQNSSTPAPNLTLWEFPNNGADSNIYRSEDLINRFNNNHTEEILKEYKVVTYLSHPHVFSKDKEVLGPVYDYIDQFNVLADSGPVIYTTLEQIYNDIEGVK